ncbi:hypothetical protein [Leptolyngbya sp. GGD]|uniref:hypothetical protein n=1 Tax=Leptolyngbya sp. GGD TaxID=2997907 RepID=UPI00227D57D5|nr:hypothetical protein [Leptolyngbya sp. GGD]MCY6494592.1 hypothetical protein [Leptolyngbya sp. GGD]
MADPFSALGIAALAFLSHFAQSDPGKKFIESIVGKLGEKTLETGLKKSDELKAIVVKKLWGNAAAEHAIAAAEQGNPEGLQDVGAFLRLAMSQDQEFAAQVRQIAEQIIHIDKIEGRNVQNNYGGENYQVNEPQGTTVQGGTNNTYTFNFGKD